MKGWDPGASAGHGPVFGDVGLFSFLPSFIPQVTSLPQLPWTEHASFLMDPSTLWCAGSCRKGPLVSSRYSEAWVAHISIIKGCGNFCRWLIMFAKAKEFFKQISQFSQESTRKFYYLNLFPTLTERSQATAGSGWFSPSPGSPRKVTIF